MLGSEILDVAIGLVLVYLVLSLVCSAIREGLEGWLKTRSTHLEAGIRELLHDRAGTGLTRDIYGHPLVYSLYRGEYDPGKIGKNGVMPSRANLPSYIPSRNFAVALMDIVARGPSVEDPSTAAGDSPPLSVEVLRARIADIQNAPVQRALLIALDQARGDLAQAQKNIEAWFDSGMDRVSGWYKRNTQKILFFLGLSVTVLVNANTLTIAEFLYRDENAREALATRAETVSRNPAILQNRNTDSLRAELSGLGLPIGWENGLYGTRTPPQASRWSLDGLWGWWLAPLFGWLITAFAISLGAPFWFDLLNKFMVVRSTVKPHEKSPEEASEDRQRPEHRHGSGAAQPPAQQPPPQQPPAQQPPAQEPPPQQPVQDDPDFQPHTWAPSTGAADPEEGVI